MTLLLSAKAAVRSSRRALRDLPMTVAPREENSAAVMATPKERNLAAILLQLSQKVARSLSDYNAIYLLRENNRNLILR